jgi:uncharacterized protein
VIFEWDDRKRRANLRKHGFDFADCARLFEGPVITEPDDRFAYGELRMWAFGLLHRRVIAVAFVEDDAVIRVISMRKAARHEKARYIERIKAESLNLEGFEN